jgi:hypothetical protein
LSAGLFASAAVDSMDIAACFLKSGYDSFVVQSEMALQPYTGSSLQTTLLSWAVGFHAVLSVVVTLEVASACSLWNKLLADNDSDCSANNHFWKKRQLLL